MRVENHPVLVFENRERAVFSFNGRMMEGFAGEPVAAALHAQGVRILGHSHKDGRPRGFYCAIGNCASCKMIVNGVSNVRVCIEPLTEGMVVETQSGKGAVG